MTERFLNVYGELYTSFPDTMDPTALRIVLDAAMGKPVNVPQASLAAINVLAYVTGSLVGQPIKPITFGMRASGYQHSEVEAAFKAAIEFCSQKDASMRARITVPWDVIITTIFNLIRQWLNG